MSQPLLRCLRGAVRFVVRGRQRWVGPCWQRSRQALVGFRNRIVHCLSCYVVRPSESDDVVLARPTGVVTEQEFHGHTTPASEVTLPASPCPAMEDGASGAPAHPRPPPVRRDQRKASHCVEHQHETDAQNAVTVPLSAHSDQPQVDKAGDHRVHSLSIFADAAFLNSVGVPIISLLFIELLVPRFHTGAPMITQSWTDALFRTHGSD